MLLWEQPQCLLNYSWQKASFPLTCLNITTVYMCQCVVGEAEIFRKVLFPWVTADAWRCGTSSVIKSLFGHRFLNVSSLKWNRPGVETHFTREEPENEGSVFWRTKWPFLLTISFPCCCTLADVLHTVRALGQQHTGESTVFWTEAFQESPNIPQNSIADVWMWNKNNILNKWNKSLMVLY